MIQEFEKLSRADLIAELTKTKQQLAQVEAERKQLSQAITTSQERLYMLGRQLNSAHTEAEVLEQLVGIVDDLDTAALHYIDLDEAQQPEWLTLMISWQRPQTKIANITAGTRYYLPDYPFSKLWIERYNPQIISDVAETDILDVASRKIFQQLHVEAMVIVPLRQGDRWVGLLTYYWESPRVFSLREEEIFNALPALVSPIIENRRLVNNLEQVVLERTGELQGALRLATRFKALVEATSDFVALTDFEGNMMYVNPNGLTLVGFTEVNPKNTMLSDYMTMETFNEIREIYLPIVREQSIWSGETVLRHKSGANIPVSQVIFLLLDGAGQAVGYGTIARDISRRRRVEQELARHRETLEEMVADRTHRLELITKLSNDINQMLDVEQLLSALVEQIKDSFGYYHVHVYLLDEKTGQLLLRAGVGEVVQKLKKAHYQLQVGKGIVGTVAANNRALLSNDISITAEYIQHPLLPNTQSELAVPIRTRSQLLGVIDVQNQQKNGFNSEDVALMQSIADQTAIALHNARLLAERQATIAQLQATDRAKSQFITMISHELRTPLNAINGFAELLLNGLSGELSAQVEEDVRLIYDSGQHLLRLINEILDITQIEAGKIQLLGQTLTISEVVHEVVATINPLLRDKPLNIKTVFPDDLPPIYADYTRLKQILLNLIGNAIKFTLEGTVTIRAMLPSDAPTMARIEIIDTGIGIPADKLELVFEKFQQVDMTDAREYGGTGLGLSISQQLVHLHGGQIGLESEVGVGSMVWFTMPVDNAAIEVS